MKTPEEIKNFETKKELTYVAFGKVSYEGCHKIAAKALAYIQRLEAQNAELVRKTEQLKEGASFTLTVKEQDVKGAVKKAYESFEIDGKKLSEWIKLLADYKRQDWISVEDRLPEEPGEVLMVLYGGVCIAWYHIDGRFESGSGMVFSAGKAVTHWMPLPAPPAEETDYV